MEIPNSILTDPTIMARAKAEGLTPRAYMQKIKIGLDERASGGIVRSLEIPPALQQRTFQPSRPLALNDNDITNAGVLDPNVLQSSVKGLPPAALETPLTLTGTGAGEPEVPEGFTVLKMPTGSDHSVLFNPKTGETRPYTNASRQLFSNSVLERDIQALARDEYGRINVSEPILTAERLAAKAQEDLQAGETGENLQASLSADAALSQAMLAQENYDPSVENATATSLKPFIDLPHGLDTFEEDYTPNPNDEPPEGFHQMADGSMMADAEMSGGYDEVPPPALENSEIRNGLTPNPSALLGAADPYAPPVGPVLEDLPTEEDNGILADRNTAPAAPPPILNTDLGSSNGVRGSGSSGTRPTRPTGNARGSNMPYAKIGMGETLLRAGLAGMGGADKSFGASMGAIGQSYGQTQDANRATGIAEAQANEASRIANARQNAINAKNAAAAAKGAKGMPSAQSLMYGKAALSAIERTENLVASEQSWVPWDNTTGIFGNLMKNIPSSAANDVMANIKTIEAAVGFDRLQAMRDASPTGGALGQVSNIELDLLKSSLANLNQAQSKEQFLTNLAQVKEVYNDIVNGGAGAPAASNGSNNTTEYLLNKYAPTN